MKKLFATYRLRSFMMAMFVLSLAVVGCKKEGGEIDPIVSGGKSVEGSWQITAMKISPALEFDGKRYDDLLNVLKELPEGDKAVSCLKQSKITFVKGGKVTASAAASCESEDESGLGVENNSSWKVQGDKIILTDSDGTQEYDLVLKSGSMEWQFAAEEDWDGDGTADKYTYSLVFRRL